ncbi:type II toxin-antitoxin system VapC family toxin [Mesorhizobium huakuii]|uniref:Ribonuclease VapC n=1 Tax=Mesorhizobium huakuii TaxID=28104 RepID=A0A7G6T4S5_9HYPH|nr:type II toxin-antitoxin system VapC family toxin [Mesorhizobium huakuii]QND61757.1 type II toxin-antitoxin system VapC family toxin [Mesorhizobium huakuii]QND69297.1 type II toxin-antitoxin system VapC family toxin [Mesorhizobium loti]
MTLYLLDENVLREAGSRGNANVRRWLATIDDSNLRLSAATLFEKRRGAEALQRRDPERSTALLAAIDLLEKSFSDRVLPIDGPIVAEWTRLLGEKNKDRWDLALAATARVHGLVLVTRNVKDFAGRGVRLLNPFKDSPEEHSA